MEIKVTCPCGTKYKFDVEPVNERMPWPVSCPVCNADGTELANEIISQSVAETASTQIAAPPAPAPSTGLRINRPAQSAPPPPPPAPVAPAAGPGWSARPQPRPAPQASSASGWRKALTVAAVVLALVGAGFKWARRLGRLSNLV